MNFLEFLAFLVFERSLAKRTKKIWKKNVKKKKLLAEILATRWN